MINSEQFSKKIVDLCKAETGDKPEPEDLAAIADTLSTVYAAHLAGMHSIGMFDIDEIIECADATKSLALDLCMENE